MQTIKFQHVITTLAIGAIAAGSALLGSGTATADLIDDVHPLLTSTCSFAQIDAAWHEVAPDSAARLDANPAQKAVLELAFGQPAEQRIALLDQLTDRKERMRSPFDADPATDTTKPDIGTTMLRVSDSCQKY